MNAISVRLHRFEQGLTSAMAWVDTSPLPSRIFKVSSLFFGTLAVSSLVALNVTASVTLSVVAGALAVSTYVLGRLLHHERNVFFDDVNDITNLFDHSKEVVRSSKQAQGLLRDYWTKQKLYTVLYDANAPAIDKWAYLMIPNTTRYIIEEKKIKVEKVKQELIESKKATLEEKKKLYMRQDLTRVLCYGLATNLGEDIRSTDLPQVKAGLEHCKETAEYNAQETEKDLLRTNSEIYELQQEILQLEKEVNKMRRLFCKEILPSIKITSPVAS